MLSSVRLELLPKSTIDIFVTIIENDGIEGCIASGAVAASAALADAGIEMLGLVASCSAVRTFYFDLFYCSSWFPQAVVGEEVWLDPTEEEGKISSGTLILSGMPALGTITSVWQSGKMTSVEAMKV